MISALALCFTGTFHLVQAKRNGMRAPNKAARSGLQALALLALAAPAAAQGAAVPLHLELNRLEASGENCRAYFLIDNRKGEAWKSLKLDLFALDTDGVAAKRLSVEVGPIAERKTSIKLFDFPGLTCQRFGRILLNDVMSCEAPAGSRDACLAAIDTASKVASVPFEK